MRAVLVSLIVAQAACSGFIEKRAAETTYGVLVKSMDVAKRQSDLQIAREAAPGGLVQIETFAAAYPKHGGFRKLHAEAYCQYAVGFVFDDWEDAKLGGRDAETAAIAERLRGLLKTCVDANLALLPPAWKQARAQSSDALAKLAATATRDQVGPLLWIATADATRLALDPMNHLDQVPAIKAMLTRCTALAPGYHDADAEVLLATLTSALYMLPGGTDGAPEFARARQRAGEGALMVEVMFARGTAVARKDRALFDTTLAQVLAADVTKWPERRLANELARKKAKRYQAAANQLFR